MINDAEGLEKFLVGWIKMVAKSLKKDVLAYNGKNTTAGNVVVALAQKTGLILMDASNAIVPESAMVLGDNTADNFVAARSNKRRGGVYADALPLAGLHESEVLQLAGHLGVDNIGFVPAIPEINPSEIERAIGITASFLGEANAESFFHMAKLLEKYSVASPEFINVLKEVGKNELETRFRHNGNIPVANVRQEGLGFVS